MSMATASVMQLLSGYFTTQLLYVVAELGVADVVASGPASVEEIAEAVGAHPESLHRVLRALSALGVFAQPQPRTFALTALSQCLRSDADNGLRPVATMVGSPWHWQAWGGVLEQVRSGSGGALFDLLEQDADASALFERVMSGPPEWSEAIVQACDLSSARRIVDVGGSSGTLAHAILRAHAQAEAVVFDRPSVVAGHAGHQGDPLHGRCVHQGGDFFEAVPQGGDLYLLRFVLHDWEDEEAVRILRHCAGAMAVDGRVLVIEKLLDSAGHADAALFDVTMMVLTGGRERSARDYEALMARAGLELVRVLPTRAGVFVLEARARG